MRELRDQKRRGSRVRTVVEPASGAPRPRVERAFPATTYDETHGCLAKHVKRALSDDEIDAALRAAAKRRHARD